MLVYTNGMLTGYGWVNLECDSRRFRKIVAMTAIPVPGNPRFSSEMRTSPESMLKVLAFRVPFNFCVDIVPFCRGCQAVRT